MGSTVVLVTVLFAAAFATNVPAYEPETPVYRGTSPSYSKPKYPSNPVYNTPSSNPEYPREPSIQPPERYKLLEDPAAAKEVYSAPAKSDYPIPVKTEYQQATGLYPAKQSYSTTPVYRDEYVSAPVYSRPESPKPQSGAPLAATYSKPKYQEEPVYAPPEPYSFGYTVKDEYDEYSRQESSDGKIVTGSYRVQLPDGRKQIVMYTADAQGGYNAEVKYEGEARYPETPKESDYKDQQYKPAPLHKEPNYKPIAKQDYSSLENEQ